MFQLTKRTTATGYPPGGRAPSGRANGRTDQGSRRMHRDAIAQRTPPPRLSWVAPERLTQVPSVAAWFGLLRQVR